MKMRMHCRANWAWALLCLLPSIGLAKDAGPTSPLVIRVMPTTNVFVIGESISIVVEVTNRSRAAVGFVWQVANETSSGINVEMTQLESRRQLQFVGYVGGCAEGWINPGDTWEERIDLAQAFEVDEPGRYGVCVRYREYSEEIILDAGGKETGAQLHKEMDIQSAPVEITVIPPNPETVGEIDSLFRSGKDDDLKQALALLASADIGVYRKELPALWTAVRTYQQPAKNMAFKLFLSKIDLADDRVSDDELFSELAAASTNQDSSLRIAAAECISSLHALGVRRPSLNRFVAQKIPKWFDGETSPACRAVLVRRLPVPKMERLITIVQQDVDPQVRVAAIQRLLELDPRRFIESAEAFTNLAGQITVEGKGLPLNAFVEGEIVRARQTLQLDEERSSAPSPK